VKYRLDELLVKKHLVDTLEKARAIIGAGEVFINETRVDKSGYTFPENVSIRLKKHLPYVSRGGIKLEKGLKFFQINPQNLVCIDVGASTGGFTDCLLQHGALKVYAVDVAYGQLDWSLRTHPGVCVLERCNARNLTKKLIPEPVDLAVMDASFISLKKLIPPLFTLFSNKVAIVALIKPQFEIQKSKLERGGVVRDKVLHDEVLETIITFAKTCNLKVEGITESPITGPKGNKEFLIYLTGSKDINLS
jgi:23S rRNA (cytidine1920-2'-O)/16S rRNA (cytidine1409-2'-O)-methyltransferase